MTDPKCDIINLDLGGIMKKENIEETGNISGAKNNTPEILNNSQIVDDGNIITTKFNFLRKRLFIVLLPSILVLVAIFAAFFLLTKQSTEKTNIVNIPTSSPKQFPSITSTETALETKVREKDVLLELGVGYQIAIDKTWGIKIIESGKLHNFLTANVSNLGVRIEVEAFSHTLPNWQKYLGNDLYQIEKTEMKKINDSDVRIEAGKETFAQSNAKLIIGTWDNKDKTLVIRVIGNNQTSINSLFEQLSLSVSAKAQKTSFKLVKEVKAAESTIPSKLPNMQYKEIEVMGALLEDMIISKDASYKDGYAKGYKFVAFKSQKLASYAEQDASLGKSYIHSQLFDSNGNAISSEMGTHIEFKATYTGEYFLIVWTFNKQEGKVTVRIDDNDQLGCSSIIKYPDGAELAMNPEEHAVGGDVIVGAFDVGYIYQCPKPITLLNDTTVQVETVPRKSGEAPKLMSWQVNVWISADMYKPKEGKNTTFVPAEDKDSNKVEFKIQQLGANRILITPENGLFLKSRQATIRGWGTRFFTQTKLAPPDFPILKEILEKFADDFQPKQTYDFAPIESMYFDWKNEDNVETEAYGGWLWYRKPITSDDEGKSLLDKYKEYFTDKGYTVSERNNYQGQSSKDPTRQKWTTGLSISQTVCKIIYDSNTFSMYCGNLQ